MDINTFEVMEDIYTKNGTTDYHNKPANKYRTGNWKACYLILGTEFGERLAFYGITANLVNYLVLRFGQANGDAVKSVSMWTGTCYITPMIGGFIADAYWGKYLTIAVFSFVYFSGMVLLTLSTCLPGLKPLCVDDDQDGAKVLCKASGRQTLLCFIALYIIALGSGGIKPCISSFGADQFDDHDELERAGKASYFNWFYFSVNFGGFISVSVCVWIQMNLGWEVGFGIATIAMAIAAICFYSGTQVYRHQSPAGSPLVRICQVIVASFKKWDVTVPDDKSLLYETIGESVINGSGKLDHTEGFRFLDKAAVDNQLEIIKGTVDHWTLCTVTQVEELKSVIRLLPIWATGIVFAAVYGQITTMFVLQGNTLDPSLGRFKIPSASLSIFDTMSVVVWIPIYDYYIVPFARKFTNHRNGFTQIQRMGIGLFISIFSMLCAGRLERRRLELVRRNNLYNDSYLPMSILQQIPQYFIIGCAEVFTFIGQMQFFYDQAPDAMRSVCSALALITVALGNYFIPLLVSIIRLINPTWIPDYNLNMGHLDYYFWGLAGLSALNLVAFLYVARLYTYKKPKRTTRW